MDKIDRGTGKTESEKYLARLADRTFLDLWSYPNTFNDRQHRGRGDGKELCDLLVVCGDDVIIFSDKSNAWPPGDDVALCWSRWYRRAVEKSVNQIRGAERWLLLHPDRIFIDAACTVRLPIDLPPSDRIRVHGIAVALGAQEACSKYFKDADGSMMLNSLLVGPQHTDPAALGHTPFAFGDVDPDGSFVHVFDETALDLVMGELDTIADFTAYLIAREQAVRGKKVMYAPSEADLLAVYLRTDVGDGEHGFLSAEQLGGDEGDHLVIGQGEYATYASSDEYRAKLDANAVSYAWDGLIQQFTANILAGTSIPILGVDPNTALAERALRGMALENRTTRRALGQAFVGALEQADARTQDRFARVIVPLEGSADPECGHVFLIMAFRQKWIVAEGYESYRDARVKMLRAYCEVALFDNRHLKRMLGIAVDGRPAKGGKKGGSEDLMLVEIEQWTPESEAEVIRIRKALGILVQSRLRPGRITLTEFPDMPRPDVPAAGNRRERRSARSKNRRR
jgi:hypothetical protein